MPMQFENMINPQTHSQTTALEIIDNFPEGLDYMITGVGTGGHISGVAKVLKNKWPKIKVFAVEPKESSVLSGEKPGPHVIQGIGAGFVPKTLDINILDGIIRISGEEAYLYAQKAAKEEGLLIGISSGASLAAIATKAKEIKGKKILSFAYDTGERYLSIENFIG
jgi:cysteine synthase A